MATSYDRMEKAFRKYHLDNPHVYRLYVRFAYQAKRAGHRTLSISLLTERVRWETIVLTHQQDGFKLCNNHKPFYARKLACHPDFTGMFVLKRQTSRQVEV